MPLSNYTRPGLNWRPSACEADIMATQPLVLVEFVFRLVVQQNLCGCIIGSIGCDVCVCVCGVCGEVGRGV